MGNCVRRSCLEEESNEDETYEETGYCDHQNQNEQDSDFNLSLEETNIRTSPTVHSNCIGTSSLAEKNNEDEKSGQAGYKNQNKYGHEDSDFNQALVETSIRQPSSIHRSDTTLVDTHNYELELAEKLRKANCADLETEAELLKQMGIIYYERGCTCEVVKEASTFFIKASALFNSAKLRTKDEEKKQVINLAMTQNEVSFIKHIGNKTDTIPITLADKFKTDIYYFRNIIARRTEIVWQEAKQNYDKEGTDEKRVLQEREIIQHTRTLCHEIAEGMKEFIRRTLQECVAILGPAPQKYAIVGLGSLAREEMTPYSDLEFIILLENDEIDKQYFRNMTNIFNMFVLNLGETLLPAVGIKSLNDFDSKNGSWFFDKVSINGFSLDGAMPWACKTPLGRPNRLNKAGIELIQSPVSMAKCLEKEFSLKEGYHLAEILRTVTFIDGSKELFEYFLHLSMVAGKDVGIKQYGLNQLKFDMQKYEKELGMHRPDEESALQNVKKEIYRLPTIVTNGFKLIFNLKNNTPWKLLEEMMANSILTEHGCHNLQMAVSVAVLLRLVTYIKNEGQKENITFLKYFGSGQEERKVHYVDFNEFIFRYYFTVLPLLQCLDEKKIENETALHQISETLRNSVFYEKTDEVQGDIYCKLHSYKTAFKHYKIALAGKGTGRYDKSSPEHASLLASTGKVCWNLADYERACAYHQQSLAMRRQLYGKTRHPAVANALNDIAKVYYAQGDYDKALSYYQQSMDMRRQMYGDTAHPEIAISLNNIALVYDAQGDYDRALNFHQQSLDTGRQVYGDTAHSDNAISLDNIALVYSKQGDYDKALTYHQQSLRVQRQLYGDTVHPEVAHTLNNIGQVYDAQADYDQALTYYQQSLDMRRQMYDDSVHPEVAVSLNNIAVVYSAQGDYDKALTYYQQSLDIEKQAYGDTAHPIIATSLNNIAQVYHAQSNYDKALIYHQQSLDMMRQVYGAKAHPEVAIAIHNIAQVYYKQGDYDKALNYQQQSLHMSRQVYGHVPHPAIAAILSSIAEVYCVHGDYNDALIYHQQSLDMSKQVYGDIAHPDIAISLGDIANVHSAQGDYDKALAYHQQSLDMARKVYGDTAHPGIATSLNNIALVYYKQGDYDKSLTYQQQSLDMQRQVYGDVAHPEIAASLNNIAPVYQEQGDYDKALSCYQESLEMVRLVYGDIAHPQIATLLDNIAGVFYEQGDYDETLTYYQQSLDIRRQLYSDTAHPEVAFSVHKIALIFAAIGDYNSALTYENQALEMFKQVYSNNSHPDICRSKETVAVIHKAMKSEHGSKCKLM